MKFASLFVVAVSAADAEPEAGSADGTACSKNQPPDCAWEKPCMGLVDGNSSCANHEGKAVRCTVEGKSGAAAVDCSAKWKQCLDVKKEVVDKMDNADAKAKKCTDVNENCKLNPTPAGDQVCTFEPLKNCKCPAEKLGVAMVFFLAAVTTFM